MIRNFFGVYETKSVSLALNNFIHHIKVYKQYFDNILILPLNVLIKYYKFKIKKCKNIGEAIVKTCL